MVPSGKAPNLAFQAAAILRGKTVVRAVLTVRLACVRQGRESWDACRNGGAWS
jgi:hypothetical protein